MVIYIIVKFCTNIAHDKTIPHIKQNFQMCTDIIDDDIILLKFERFRQKGLNFKMLYLSGLWIKDDKNWEAD